ncbi:VanZ family protein [Microbacterium sp. CFH 31415]|uniref:VanZ family protein n=1 Tax=Microbacterium sp. CFH 31415 TaxID=2921732 RepID=UPI001F13515E|nr:VanZ family protein [Microbacterium sp. CFH 31415]MCH6229957.1 VanZ family protein [Microbacterium sp. CFH 31415]
MSNTAPTAPTRAARAIAAALAVTAVGILTLGPRALVAPARGAFLSAVDAASAPLLAWFPYGDAERVLNTIMFVPLGATIALLLGRRWWPLAILGGFALSACVEYAQRSIPGRVPDPADVLWNTVGAAIGVIVVTAVRLVCAAVRALARPDRMPQPTR